MSVRQIPQLSNLGIALRVGARSLRQLGVGPAQGRLLWQWLRRQRFPRRADAVHLQAAMAWLCASNEVHQRQGVATGFGITDGWGAQYPEVSGYAIPTMLNCAARFPDMDLRARAHAIADWEIAIQSPSGGVLSSLDHSNLRVFNTGQVMLGWCRLYEVSGQPQYLAAAVRAADFLAGCQEADGSWRQHTLCGPRTYHVGAAWPLLYVHRLTQQPVYRRAAEQSLRWVLAQQQPNGWFAQCGLENDWPITHVIGYTLHGLLEAHALLTLAGDTSALPADLLAAAERYATALRASMEQQWVYGIPGMAADAFDAGWQGRTSSSCLTGNVQIAYCFQWLAKLLAQDAYGVTARLLLDAVCTCQDTASGVPGVMGGVPGSYPFYRGYCTLRFPNWAAKFLVDALLLQQDGTTCYPYPSLATPNAPR